MTKERKYTLSEIREILTLAGQSVPVALEAVGPCQGDSVDVFGIGTRVRVDIVRNGRRRIFTGEIITSIYGDFGRIFGVRSELGDIYEVNFLTESISVLGDQTHRSFITGSPDRFVVGDVVEVRRGSFSCRGIVVKSLRDLKYLVRGEDGSSTRAYGPYMHIIPRLDF